MTTLAANLSTAQSKAKEATFKAYSAHDVNARHYANSYPPYQHRRYHRWTPGSLRAVPAGTGVSVFGVIDQQVVQWTCADVTDRWSGPFALGGVGVRALDAVTQIDGRIRLFALRVDAIGGVSGIITSVQDSPGGRFGPWSEPQNPFPTTGAAASAAMLRGDALGQPAAVATPDGAVHLFVRAADATVYLRTLINGDRTWLPWSRLGGRFVLDGVSPLVGDDGLLQLYATAMAEPADQALPAVARLVRWAQPRSGGPLTADALFPAAPTAGSPLAVLDRTARPRAVSAPGYRWHRDAHAASERHLGPGHGTGGHRRFPADRHGCRAGDGGQSTAHSRGDAGFRDAASSSQEPGAALPGRLAGFSAAAGRRLRRWPRTGAARVVAVGVRWDGPAAQWRARARTAGGGRRVSGPGSDPSGPDPLGPGPPGPGPPGPGPSDPATA